MDYLKILLRSDLCAGNGESVGNEIDKDICMDEAGLPYIPSRRLKGCLKQAALDLEQMGYPEAGKKRRELFGDAYGKEGCLFLQDAVVKDAEELRKLLMEKIPADDRGSGKTSGKIPDAVKRSAHPANVQRMFSKVRGQTRLKNGVKVKNTLRFTRVISQYDPFVLENETEMKFYAPVYLETKDHDLKEFFQVCCRTMRHIGSSRNRGLGNVTVTFRKENGENSEERRESEKASHNAELLKKLNKEEQVKISFHITLDAPVTLPGCDEINTSIPARSIIGCLAAGYLRNGRPEDETFRSLFLNGQVRWSALTPVIDGIISDPAPMMLVKLKNREGQLMNHLAAEDTAWKNLKPKTVDGAFAVLYKQTGKKERGYAVAQPSVHTVYHYTVNGTVQDEFFKEVGNGRTLYMQDSIDAGTVYGGTVICTAEKAEDVIKCLKSTKLRFGRSRSAQYAGCSLKEEPDIEVLKEEKITALKGEPVYVILKSDLALQKEARYVTNNEAIRQALAEQLPVTDELPDKEQDYCRYHTIGGYQNTWQLQKPQVPVVRAGSVYCFKASGDMLPSYIQVGDFQQERFGVCTVLTTRQMKDTSLVREGTIERAAPKEVTERIQNIYIKLLTEAGFEAMQRYAMDYSPEQRGFPIGRLRLMLSKAKDYAELLNMIGSIRESDVNSENEIGRKKISENLVRNLYGENEGSNISLKKVLSKEEGLWEEIQNYPIAKKLLLEKWKVPLGIVLHKEHYKKER